MSTKFNQPFVAVAVLAVMWPMLLFVKLGPDEITNRGSLARAVLAIALGWGLTGVWMVTAYQLIQGWLE